MIFNIIYRGRVF